jgi:hypothetical protein
LGQLLAVGSSGHQLLQFASCEGILGETRYLRKAAITEKQNDKSRSHAHQFPPAERASFSTGYIIAQGGKDFRPEGKSPDSQLTIRNSDSRPDPHHSQLTTDK